MTRDHRLYACRKHALVDVFLGRPAGRLQRVAIAKLIVERLIFPVERLKVFGEETVCLRQLDIQIGVELVFFVSRVGGNRFQDRRGRLRPLRVRNRAGGATPGAEES